MIPLEIGRKEEWKPFCNALDKSSRNKILMIFLYQRNTRDDYSKNH
jgi:hypothetical protein